MTGSDIEQQKDTEAQVQYVHGTGDEKTEVNATPLSLEQQKTAIDSLADEYGINQRKLMAKIDFRIVPAICFLYLLAFLDRVNISNANVYGMSKDIGLIGNQYNVCLTIFFVPYIVSEVPSNYLLKKFKPHVWLSLCMFLFGIVSIGQGFVKSYSGLLATRFFLGLLEAGMFPGCFYLLSMWYRRDEAQKRYSFFFTSTCLAGAFGGLIAYGCFSIDGKRGIAGWQWIFIIEGTVTAVGAIILFFCIADFPEDAKFLNANEQAFLKAKLEYDVGSSNHEDKFTLKDIGRVFKEWKVYLAGLMYFCLIIPAYGYAYFSTAIIRGFNYSPVQTQLYSIPPWACAFGFSMIVAFFSDRFRHRYVFAIFTALICAVGFIILLTVKTDNHARYAGCFLVAMGAYTSMPLIVCWTSQNFAGHLRRSVGTGFQIGFGNIGGIIATFSFMAQDGPLYLKGVSIGLAFSLFCVVLTTVYFLGVYYDNRARTTGKYLAKWEKMTEREKETAGDLRPEFRYTY
ncbi:high-affinity nicotinic acid transporter [Trichomonascus vanleenenianus]|uniref:high-affinity nicotinic acid transporter n=1 Tax=Trichomonascus vanleenenianus TaxID=2268995 RepID=UPI003EC96EEF